MQFPNTCHCCSLTVLSNAIVGNLFKQLPPQLITPRNISCWLICVYSPTGDVPCRYRDIQESQPQSSQQRDEQHESPIFGPFSGFSPPLSCFFFFFFVSIKWEQFLPLGMRNQSEKKDNKKLQGNIFVYHIASAS